MRYDTEQTTVDFLVRDSTCPFKLQIQLILCYAVSPLSTLGQNAIYFAQNAFTSRYERKEDRLVEMSDK